MAHDSGSLGGSWALDHDSQVYYDAWAAQYEADILKAGYRLPYVAAAVVAHHLSPATRPILDAGCGTGLQVEPLILLGYGPFISVRPTSDCSGIDSFGTRAFVSPRLSGSHPSDQTARARFT